jgi:hypothetical protein
LSAPAELAELAAWADVIDRQTVATLAGMALGRERSREKR